MRAFVIVNSTSPDGSVSSRCNSDIVLAGTMQLISSAGPFASSVFSTDILNPSAAASVSEVSVMSTFTPVSAGRESSVAAENTTRSSAPRSLSPGMVIDAPSLTEGMGGNSAASVPLIVASKLAHLMWMPFGSLTRSISTFSGGSEFTKSESMRAGMVMAPSLSI